MKIFITGLTGFIGRQVAENLLASQNELIAPVRTISIHSLVVKNFKNKGVNIIEGNFYDGEILDKISKYNIDLIVHFASIRGEGFGDWEDYQKINVIGTKNLLKFAKQNGINRFIYCSTVGVLGTIPISQPARSENNAMPDSLYHKSKWQAEQLVREFHSAELNTCILRPTITYGTGDDGFIPKLVQMVVANKFILPKKDVYIHLLSVEALVRFISQLVNLSGLNGKTYIIADKNPVLLSELVGLISNLINKKTYPRYFYLPMIFFKAVKFGLNTINQQRLLTSVQLISDNWTYDISASSKDLNFRPSDTLDTIKPIILEYSNE